MEKQPFYLTKRKLASGKSVYYYYLYDKDGNRTTPKTTGCTRKADAINFCTKLMMEHRLNITHIKLKDYADNFFEKGGYWDASGRDIKDSSRKIYLSYCKVIMKYFGNEYVDNISTSDIIKFRLDLANSGYKNATINTIILTFKIILEMAVADDVIYKNPINAKIRTLKEDKNREAFTFEEIDYILKTPNWKSKSHFVYVLTAVITGMRISEIAGITVENVYEDYIDVCQQFYNGKITSTKSDSRYVPIPSRLRDLMLSLAKSGYVFKNKRIGVYPMNPDYARNELIAHFSEQMKKEKKKRLLGFHSLRYFTNTYFISNNIAQRKVDFVIGHSDGKNSMTELYTTWRPEMFTEIKKLQEELLEKLLDNNPNV